MSFVNLPVLYCIIIYLDECMLRTEKREQSKRDIIYVSLSMWQTDICGFFLHHIPGGVQDERSRTVSQNC